MAVDSKKKSVLIVHNYYQIPGGEDTVVSNEKQLLEKNGHKVVLYTRTNSELKKMSKLQKIRLLFTTIYNPKTATDIKRIINSEEIDIVHVHNTLNLISPAVYYAAKKCRVPVVQSVHNFRLLCPGAMFYRDGHICEDCVEKGLGCAVKHNCYRESKIQTLICVISTIIHRMTGIYGKLNYICLTEFNKSKLLNCKQIKSDNVFVKPNFARGERICLPAEKRKNQFVFAGRLDKLKGIDLLLEAWRYISGPKLFVCGTGPLEKWCKNIVNANNLNVEIMGFLENEKVLQLISESRALILPTRWYEGFPMSIVEAFSVGTPVICTDIGNAGALIKNGITGWKFSNIEELVSAIQRNDILYDNVIQEYQEKYTDKKNYKELQEIYQCVKDYGNIK